MHAVTDNNIKQQEASKNNQTQSTSFLLAKRESPSSMLTENDSSRGSLSPVRLSARGSSDLNASEQNDNEPSVSTRRLKGEVSTQKVGNGIQGCSQRKTISFSLNGKQVVAVIMGTTLALLVWDATMRPPEERWLKKETSAEFLQWVEGHPSLGIGAFLIVIAICVVFMIPVGTPLTLGCGYIYKGVYGWTLGIAVATAVSMAGSALGAVSCFLLGRYMMRERVRKWIRKYPLFDAIDVAAAEHGLRIMAMLYLTPILPLGPVSYMCGSTSMALSSFVLAKVASLPLMTLYVFIGASAGALITDAEAIENNATLIVSGIILSMVMIAGISHYIRKELMRILERQKKTSGKEADDTEADPDIELGVKSDGMARHRTRVGAMSPIT